MTAVDLLKLLFRFFGKYLSHKSHKTVDRLKLIQIVNKDLIFGYFSFGMNELHAALPQCRLLHPRI